MMQLEMTVGHAMLPRVPCRGANALARHGQIPSCNPKPNPGLAHMPSGSGYHMLLCALWVDFKVFTEQFDRTTFITLIAAYNFM